MPRSKIYLMTVTVSIADMRRLNLMEGVEFDAYVHNDRSLEIG